MREDFLFFLRELLMKQKGGYTMMIREFIKVGDNPTKEQLEQVELASTKPIVYDDDCPELTIEQIKAFECVARQRNRFKKVN